MSNHEIVGYKETPTENVSGEKNMASSARIDGSLPDLTSATTGIAFTGQWAVTYDWVGARVKPVGQPA